MGLIEDLDTWWEEHQYDIDVDTTELAEALEIVQGAMDIVGE